MSSLWGPPHQPGYRKIGDGTHTLCMPSRRLRRLRPGMRSVCGYPPRFFYNRVDGGSRACPVFRGGASRPPPTHSYEPFSENFGVPDIFIVIGKGGVPGYQGICREAKYFSISTYRPVLWIISVAVLPLELSLEWRSVPQLSWIEPFNII